MGVDTWIGPLSPPNWHLASSLHLRAEVEGQAKSTGRHGVFRRTDVLAYRRAGVPAWAWLLIGAAAGGIGVWLTRDRLEKLAGYFG